MLILTRFLGVFLLLLLLVKFFFEKKSRQKVQLTNWLNRYFWFFNWFIRNWRGYQEHWLFLQCRYQNLFLLLHLPASMF